MSEKSGWILLQRDIDSADVIGAIEGGLALEAQLEATRARRTSGWLFNQPIRPLEPMFVETAAGERFAVRTVSPGGTGFVP